MQRVLSIFCDFIVFVTIASVLFLVRSVMLGVETTSVEGLAICGFGGLMALHTMGDVSDRL